MKNHITQELILALSLALLFAACNSETKLPIVGAHSRAEQHLPADLQQPAPPQDRRHLPELDYRLNLVHLAALEHGEVAALALARELLLLFGFPAWWGSSPSSSALSQYEKPMSTTPTWIPLPVIPRQ